MKYGPKLMFGLSNLLAAFFTLLLPIAAYHSFEAVLILRILHGLFGGSCFPFLHAITAKWIPPNERANFITTYLGSAPAIAIVYPLFGWVISVSGWENVFYISGAMALTWCVVWYFFMFDSPSQHPRISKEERDYIENALDQTVHNKRLPIPWKEILLSRQVWLNTLANFSYSIAFMLSITYFPMYFKHVHNMDLKSSAAVAGLPHFVRLIAAIFCGRFADALLREEKASRTSVRKWATAACTLFSGLMFLGLALCGDNSIPAIFLVILVVTTTGLPNAGFFAAMVDIAPNFASIVLGFGTIAGSASSILVTLYVGWLTDGNQADAQWQKIFYMAAGFGIIPGVLYVMFADASVQSWNSPKMEPGGEEGSNLGSGSLDDKNQTKVAMESTKVNTT